MAQGDATSADVPGRYDVVINGKGYILLQSLEPSLPFRTHRALYSYSPTFVDRSNVSNAYGDNAQDFFLTIRQRDWSLGEQQKYYRANQDGRYWAGTNVDVATPGQVTLTQQTPSLSFAAAVRAGCQDDFSGDRSPVTVASSTNLYRVKVDGTITDLGAHGLGSTPSKYGMVNDASVTYLSTTTAGTVGVRSWNGSAFATFSTSGADSLAFLNNTLYGWRASNSDLVRWDGSGTITSLFTWKNVAGTSGSGGTNINIPMLATFGGKLLILFTYTQEASELWIYDGAGCSRLEVLPPNFYANSIKILYGTAYIGGNFYKSADASNLYARPAVLFYDGSQVGLLWQAYQYGTTKISTSSPLAGPLPALGINNGHLIFTDDTMNALMSYNPALGGVSTIGTYTAGGTDPLIFSTGSMVVMTRNQTTGYYFPNATTYNTSGTVTSSLIDFDSSLPKTFRGVKVEFDSASDGDGGSVDIAYQIESLTGAWTTLRTGAASGTEYTLSNVTGHSIAIRITLNKGTSTAGPTLKAMNVRGAPELTTYRQRTYILDLSGIGRTDSGARLADGTEHPLNGHQQADNLNAAITSTTPITVSDRFTNQQTSLNGSTTTDSFTAVCVPAESEIYDVREGWDNPQYPGGYVAKISVREV